MYIEQLYTGCLAHAAYYIESNGEAAVIDPLRDPEPYIELASKRNAKIRYIIETHFHADFVSGHLDLAKKTGAAILLGPGATPAYNAVIAKDLGEFPLGKTKLVVLHTPGHTLESCCFLLPDENGKPYAVFTGDTLFVGEVGRPDLLSGNLPKEELASMLFDSLNQKIKTLPDDVLVYPGHGAGSACGKNIGRESFSTIGAQKKNNYALQIENREDFISAVTSGLPAPPAYFFKAAAYNKTGYPAFDELLKINLHALNAAQFKEEMRNGALILDTRDAVSFGDAFIPGSVNIGLGGDFAVWAGTVITPGTRLVLILPEEKEQEAVTRLMRIGFDNIGGFLSGGIKSWTDAGGETNSVLSVDPEDLPALLTSGNYVLLDVRRQGEVEKEKLSGSLYISLSELPEKLAQLDKNERYLVYCAGGYRSMIASSLMKKNGFARVLNISGGISRVKKEAAFLVA